ncbi:MAG: hypothetical protein WBA77_00085 [Microcoleaceae cyanobacterium]
MTKHLKIQDLDNFQEDLSQEFATTDLAIIQGGIAEARIAIDSDEELIAYPYPEPEPLPLPEPEPYPIPLPPYPTYPCGCHTPYPYPEKPIKGGDYSLIGWWCPVIL